MTGPSGNFEYEEGGKLQFFIGDLALGGSVPGKTLITLPDLINEADYNSPAVVNIARLLLSLDAVPGDAAITIPPSLHDIARRDNGLVSASIEHLDFRDDMTFVNTASQLVAVLTNDYPFTASLVDAEPARNYLDKASKKRLKNQ